MKSLFGPSVSLLLEINEWERSGPRGARPESPFGLKGTKGIRDQPERTGRRAGRSRSGGGGGRAGPAPRPAAQPRLTSVAEKPAGSDVTSADAFSLGGRAGDSPQPGGRSQEKRLAPAAEERLEAPPLRRPPPARARSLAHPHDPYYRRRSLTRRDPSPQQGLEAAMGPREPGAEEPRQPG